MFQNVALLGPPQTLEAPIKKRSGVISLEPNVPLTPGVETSKPVNPYPLVATRPAVVVTSSAPATSPDLTKWLLIGLVAYLVLSK